MSGDAPAPGQAEGPAGPPLTAVDARRSLAARLRAAGIESASLEARLLVEGAIGDAAAADDRLLPLAPAAQELIAAYEARRLAGEPVWRILGEREFWGLTFRLSPDTLEPRPDSEALVEAALATLAGRRDEALGVLDLGTGTGCLLLAILSEFPQARGLGIDLAPGAVATAQANAMANGLAGRARFRQGDWAAGLDRRFDLIVSNPPYIPQADIAGLEIGVRGYDPLLALDGGRDGLEPYRIFARTLPGLLAAGGVIILEIGAGQQADVTRLMQGAGLRAQGARHDLGGHPRALIFAA